MKRQKSITWRNYKKRLFSAAVSLLIATVMIVSAGYAWLVLSTAPEVVGIETNIGANGSLEIALLNTTTYNDLSAITTRVGDSADRQGQSLTTANETWGNIVNLSDASYGLDQITLNPGQLVISPLDDGYTSSPIAPVTMPNYGTDGRIINLEENPVSAVYNSSRKFGLSAPQRYGVRALGITSSASAQQNLINLAKAYISGYSSSARDAAISTINSNGENLMTIMLIHRSTDQYNDTHIDYLNETLRDLSVSLDYIDYALRYGIVGRIVQETGEVSSTLKAEILDSQTDISNLYNEYKNYLPSGFGDWVEEYKSDRLVVNGQISACASLKGTSTTYTWSQINSILQAIIDLDHVYINDSLFGSVSFSSLMSLPAFKMTLMPGSGVFADIADFTGQYNTELTASGKTVEFSARTEHIPSYLDALNDSIASVSDGDNSLENLTIDYIGGYAIDLAFRCNAPGETELRLQTSPEQRVYSDSASTDLQGGGSFMRFISEDSSLSLQQITLLMDAIRVTFIDQQGNILAMAKLNTSNRVVNNNDRSIRANLYLYDYSVINENSVNTIKVGERRTGKVDITKLTQNTAKAVSAVVWLDGNIVDNTMVSALYETSLKGILNLQFSSSADLSPAKNDILYNSNATRADLERLLAGEIENYPIFGAYQSGQSGSDDHGNKWNYTNMSWSSFENAYINANAVLSSANSNNATYYQIKSAYNGLKKAYDDLMTVDKISLNILINEARGLAGSANEIVGYASDGNILKEGTQAQFNSLTKIYSIDPEKNLHDEGSELKTPIYKEESWLSLATALYEAEAIYDYEDATDTQIGNSLTKLELALNTLERGVYYEPYEMNGSIYYKALTDDTDTYGKWYDKDFNRVISDLTILDLDSTAVKLTTIAEVTSADYYEIGSGEPLAADILFNPPYNTVGDEIIGVRWGFSGRTYNPDLNGDYDFDALIAEAESLKDNPYISNNTQLEALIREVQLMKNGVIHNTGEDHIVSTFNSLVAAIETAKNDIENARPYINADERTVLTAAVLEAQSLEPEPESLEPEPGSVAETLAFWLNSANELLNKGDSAEKSEFGSVLDGLNNAIEAAGGTPKTAYNVLVCTVSHSSEYSEGFNRVTLPSNTIIPPYDPNDYGTGVITARILTRNGVVTTASPKTVKFYNKADRIEINVYSNDLASYSLDRKEYRDPNSGGYYSAYCNETPVAWYWSVTSGYTLTNANEASCTITGTGEAVLRLTVEMDTGSTYTNSIPINFH